MAVALLLGLFIFGLLLAIPPLRAVLSAIGHMSPSWIALAIVLELASCASFVVVFRLFFFPLAPHQARLLAWTELATGVLLPAGGVGGLAIGGWLMHLAGMSTRSIIKRSSALFFITSAASVAAMIAAGALLLTGLSAGPEDFLRAALPVLAGALATDHRLGAPGAPIAKDRSPRRPGLDQRSDRGDSQGRVRGSPAQLAPFGCDRLSPLRHRRPLGGLCRPRR